ncbi:MAG: hypothetical protein J7L25_14940 [Deltaproteobacteria bacterium]|nr:hypothetical protein [Candidatus Tharpella aukensis]
MDEKAFWLQIFAQIRKQVGNRNFNAFFRNHELVITVPDTIDLFMAKQALDDFNLLSRDEIEITVEEVIKTVADHYKIATEDILSRKRTEDIVLPRQIAMYISRTITGNSFPEIGDKFGGKDHATIMHACNKIEKELPLDKKLAATVKTLKERIVKTCQT